MSALLGLADNSTRLIACSDLTKALISFHRGKLMTGLGGASASDCIIAIDVSRAYIGKENEIFHVADEQSRYAAWFKRIVVVSSCKSSKLIQ